jgi:hypothetical protein
MHSPVDDQWFDVVKWTEAASADVLLLYAGAEERGTSARSLNAAPRSLRCETTAEAGPEPKKNHR